MIADVVAICTAAYVVIDDLYQAYLAPLDRRPGPRGQCSDSEIVALTLVAELVGLDEAVAFLAYLRRNHPTLFPRLPERSRYNRRRRALQEATGTLRRLIQRRVWAALPADRRDLCVIDSLPVPVVGFAHACGRHRWRGHAAYGYNATKKQALYGFTRHLLATHSGLILDVALVPANIVDGDLSAQLLQDQTGLTVLGDEAYLSAALRERLRHPCAGTRARGRPARPHQGQRPRPDGHPARPPHRPLPPGHRDAQQPARRPVQRRALPRQMPLRPLRPRPGHARRPHPRHLPQSAS